MKIMHTADWHLGKHLEGNSRLDEQKEMLADIIDIAAEENIDLVLIAGDIYDTFNPPAAAEQLFYRTMEQLSNNGRRIIVLISGNHDSPCRLGASLPLAIRQGIIIIDRPDFSFKSGQVGQHQLIAGENGHLELKINQETAVILAVPYPSESRLDLLLGNLADERELQQNYSAKVKEIFAELSEYYRQDTINLAMSHIFVAGSEESKSERPIQVGGGLTVAREALPAADYTALGHLHRSQSVSSKYNAYYAGSPLQYSLSELNHSKSVKIVKSRPGSEPEISTRQLRNPKPIEVWETDSIEAAYRKCQDNQDREVWAYLKIRTERPLRRSEIKELKSLKEDILSIIPITPDSDSNQQDLEIEEELNIKELFQEFYQKEHGVQPEEEIMEMFQEIIDLREGQHEAGNS